MPVLKPCQKTEKKTMEHESDDDTNCKWCARNDPQKLGKGAGWEGNQRARRDHPNNTIVKTGQNPENSSEDLLSLRLQQKTIN